MMSDIVSESEHEFDTSNYEFFEHDTSGNEIYILKTERESGAENMENDLDNNADMESNADEIVARAVRHVENTKRERRSSFEHGFDLPSEVRKRIASNNARRKKQSKEKLASKSANKQTAKHVENPSKSTRGKTKSETSSRRFQRAINKSQLSGNPKLKRKKKNLISVKNGSSETVCKRADADEETESLHSKHVWDRDSVVFQNHSQTETGNDFVLQWNVRQNSCSDLLFKHFQVVSQSGRNVKVKCKLCNERKPPISVVLGNNSNLKLHMNAVSR